MINKVQEFVDRWSGQGNEREHTQLFWIDLMTNVVGLTDATRRLKFETPCKTDADSKHPGSIDVWIPSASVLIEQKSLGIDMTMPEMRQGRMVTPVQQALGYARGLPLSKKPRYLMACNFAEFWLYDLEKDPTCVKQPVWKLRLEDIPGNIQLLSWLDGGNDAPDIMARRVSVEAGALMGRVHDLIAPRYADPNDEKTHQSLAMLLVRLMFLAYSEDARHIPVDAFRDYVRHYDAMDLREALVRLFRWLNTEDHSDPYAHELLKSFPYMDGGLFAEEIEIPTLTEDIKNIIVRDMCETFDWTEVDPTVFGSVFEGAISHDARRAGGMHYTSPENIHKVIDPLFLDDLKAEFEDACNRPVAGGARTKALSALHEKLGMLEFLDPASGSGNFLTTAYIELRRLDNRVLMEMNQDPQMAMLFDTDEDPIKVKPSHFHGIEINDYACCVARTAMWIAQKQCDMDTSQMLRRLIPPFPLTQYNNIICDNALTMDWNEVVPAEKCSYVFGNPPFIGQAMQNRIQSDEVSSLFPGVSNAGKLDYVAGWFRKAATYATNTNTKIGFVSVNSICQGESVAALWKGLFSEGCEIDFAYTTFKWNSESQDQAAVMCVIIGISMNGHSTVKSLFSGNDVLKVSHINGYLKAAPDVFITNRTKHGSNPCEVTQGSQPMEDGNLLFTVEERNAFINEYPGTESLFKPFVGSREFLHDKQFSRYCLWLVDVPMSSYKDNKEITERILRVAEYRKGNKIPRIQRTADVPMLFTQIRQPKDDFLIIPRVSSERRKYIPIGYVTPDVIASDAVVIVTNATLYDFGLLCSQAHNAWMRAVAGRLENRYRYSPSVYYNFVYPDPTDESRKAIETLAKAVLDARKAYPDSTLADMYDPDNAFLYPALMKAHRDLDKAVEAAYGVAFNGDEEKIVAHLFKLHAEKMDRAEVPT